MHNVLQEMVKLCDNVLGEAAGISCDAEKFPSYLKVPKALLTLIVCLHFAERIATVRVHICHRCSSMSALTGCCLPIPLSTASLRPRI